MLMYMIWFLFLNLIMAFYALTTTSASRVQINQRIHLTFGWEPKDDLMTTEVKVKGTRSNHKGQGVSKVRRAVRGDKVIDGHTKINPTVGEMSEAGGQWRKVEELRGEEISHASQVKKGQQYYTPEKVRWHQRYHDLTKANRRHRRDRIVEKGEDDADDDDDLEDCVMDGKSIRMKRRKGTTMESRRLEEIEKEERGEGVGGEKGGVGGKKNKGDDRRKREKEAGSRDGSKQGHVGGNHVIVMVEKGSEARLACHECSVGTGGRGPRAMESKEFIQRFKQKSKSGREGTESLLWYRLTRQKKKRRHYKIEEVSLDMHDDKSRDRVFVTRDHALVFAKTKTHDGGSYFCKSPDEGSDVNIKESVPEGDMVKLFKNPKVHYFYHLDVLKPSQEDAIIVSSPGPDANSSSKDPPPPTPPVNVTDMNLRVFTEWQGWSPCSMCDQPGTRRRVGQCVVTRLGHKGTSRNKTVFRTPVFLDAVLASYPGGVPCRSSLLHGHNALLKHILRPEEVIQEDCNVTCAVHHAQLVMSAYGFLGGEKEQRGKVLKQKKFREKEGHHVILKCQQTSVDKSVAWINGSKVLIPTHLKKTTKGRVWVDEHNSLHVKPVLPQDASSYVCLVQGQVKGFVRLEVTPSPPECKVCRYAWYLACTFPVNFVIYLVIVCAKHKERKRFLNYELLPLGSSSSSSSSTDENEEGGT